MARVRRTHQSGCGPTRALVHRHHGRPVGHTSDDTARAAVNGLGAALGP
jgi:hypothetical protein